MAFVPIDWLLVIDHKIQTFFTAQHLRMFTLLDIRQFMASVFSGLQNRVSNVWIAKSGLLKVIFIVLLTVSALSFAARKYWYQRRIRRNAYQKFKQLHHIIQQLPYFDVPAVDQEIASLTQFQAQTINQNPIALKNTPVFFSLSLHVDYTLDRLMERRRQLLNETNKAAELMEYHASAVQVDTKEEPATVTEVMGSLILTQPKGRYATRIIAWKKRIQHEQAKELEIQEQPYDQLEANLALPIDITGTEDEQNHGIKPATRCFKSYHFWKAKVKERQLAIEFKAPRVLSKQVLSGFFRAGNKKMSADSDQSVDALASSEELAIPIEAITLELPSEDTVVSSTGNTQHQQAQTIVRKHMLTGIAISTLPIPVLDIAGLTGTQLNLLNKLGVHYGVDINNKQGRSIVLAMLTGSLPTTILMWLSSATKVIPGIGTFSGGVSLSATAGAVIYATGQVFIRHFETGGELHNFNSQQQQPYFQKALKEGLAMNTK